MVISLCLLLLIAILVIVVLCARIATIDRGLALLADEDGRPPYALIQFRRLLGDSRLQRLLVLHQRFATCSAPPSPFFVAHQTDDAVPPPSEERIEETLRSMLRPSKARAWHLAYTVGSSALVRTCSAGIQLAEVLHRLHARATTSQNCQETPVITAVVDPALRWCGIFQECILTKRFEGITIHLWIGYESELSLLSAELDRLKTILPGLRREIADLGALESLSSQAREESSSRRNKEQFFSHIAHDLRSPLGNIRAILQSLAKSSPAEELLRFGAMNCDRIEQLTSDIIVLSKEQAGALKSHPRPFLVTDVIRSVGSRFSPTALQKKLEVRVDVPSRLPPVCADPSHITRVLENLVCNAIKHTWTGAITLSASLEDSGFVRCTVTDTGAGIAPEKLSMITQPFHQIHDSIADGVGLGLAIAKLLTETNGGRFSVSSKPGAGSQFSIDIPVWSQPPMGEE